MKQTRKRFISWSGGKDSTASIILCYEHGLKIDGVVISEVMFDNARNISGENPTHIAWVYNVAIPIIEKQFGYRVYVLRDSSDYVQEFHQVIKRSSQAERIGKMRGWFIGGMCIGNDRLKMRPIKRFFRNAGECEVIVGIAADEPERRDKKTMNNKRSVLVEYGITEAMTYDICRKYNLLSPIYNDRKRGGCWFCPNQSIREFALLKKQYSQLWAELKTLAQEKNVISDGFKWGQTFAQVERQVDAINSQITMFDCFNCAEHSPHSRQNRGQQKTPRPRQKIPAG